MADLKTTEFTVSVLQLIAEQYAMPIDQLGRFVEVDERDAAEIVNELGRLRYVEKQALLAGQREWIWLTKRGADRSGTRFGGMRPEAGSLERIRALNEVRLQVARRAPGARWISGRSILREQGKRGFRPHAVIEIEGEQHAVAIKLGQARAPQVEQRFAETLMARYDAVIVFAGESRRRILRFLAQEKHWSKLVVRDLPRSPGDSRGDQRG
jgi:hypothetical protein